MTQLFRNLVRDVITVTNRPNFLAETELAIRQACLSYHHLDFFWRDKVTGIINATSTALGRVKAELTDFERMRAVAEIAPYFPDDESCGKPLKQLTKLGEKQTDYWLTTHRELIIHSSSPTKMFQLTYYENPKLLPENEFSSWIAELYPTAVVDSACARVFDMAGNSTQADRYRAKVGNRNQPGSHSATIIAEQLEREIRSY